MVKNKVAPPFRLAEFDIMFGHGISREGSLLDVAVEHDVVRKSGAWYTYEDDQLGQGRENSKRFLRENPEIALQLQAQVLEIVGLVPSEDEVEAEAEEASAAETQPKTTKSAKTAKAAEPAGGAGTTEKAGEDPKAG